MGWRKQHYVHGSNLESLGFSLSYSLDGIQGITVEDFSYIALTPWSNRA